MAPNHRGLLVALKGGLVNKVITYELICTFLLVLLFMLARQYLINRLATNSGANMLHNYSFLLFLPFVTCIDKNTGPPPSS